MQPQVVIRMLRDADGQLRRVRIHWFVRSVEGPAKTPGPGNSPEALAAYPGGHPHLPGARGHIACQKARTSVEPELRNGVWHPCPHSDDPRAVSCPECQATPEFKTMMKRLEELVPTPTA